MRPLDEMSELLRSDRYSRKTLADGSGVVLDLESMRVLSLNRTGMFMLEQIVGGTDRIEALADRLTETFAVDAATAADDVRELLDQLDDRFATGTEP